MSKICNKCGNTLNDNDNSCIICGTPVIKTKKAVTVDRRFLIIAISTALVLAIAIISLVLILTNNNDNSDEDKNNNEYRGEYSDNNNNDGYDMYDDNSIQLEKDIINCPDFVGMTIDELEMHDEYDSFKFKFDYINSSEYDFGIIIDQSITPDEEVQKGSTITLTVNTGSTTIKIPSDLYGKSEEYAVTKLKSLGFITTVKYVNDEDVEEGHVIKTDPARTTVVEEGTEIIVYVSSGKEIKMVTVPNVVGLTKEKAKALIKEAGLVFEYEERDPTPLEDVAKGYVIAQEPDVNLGDTVLEGSVVKVYISTGVIRKYVKMPNVVGLYRDEAISKIQEAGLAVKIVLEPNNTSDDIVLRTDCTPGYTILEGSVITIYVGYIDDDTDN